MAPVPDHQPSAPSDPAREGRESPDDLPPHAQVDTSSRLRTTRTVLLAILAMVLVGLAILLFG